MSISKIMALALCLLMSSTLLAQKKIAIMDLKPLGEMLQDDITTLSERFRGQMVETHIFEVMDRKESESLDQETALQTSEAFHEESDEELEAKLLEAINNPSLLTQEPLFDEKALAKAGEKQGAELIVVGYVGLKESTYSIDIKMFNCTTSRIEKSISETHEGSWSELITLMEEMGRRMAGVEEKSNLWKYLTGGGVVTVATIAYILMSADDATGLPEPPSPPQ